VEHDQKAPDGAVGHRVAKQRKLSGLTQPQLAARAHVSVSLISQVERGLVPASAAFTAAVARALGVDVEALNGQPYGPVLTDPQADHAGIPALRFALDCDEDPDLDSFPMPAAELRTRLDACEHNRQKARYAQVLTVLPELLQHAYLIAEDARPGHDAETAWALLADAYLLAQATSYRFGYLDLAALCSKYCRDAAHHSGDPLRAATAAYLRGILRLHHGDYAGVLRLMASAAAEIADERGSAADAVRTVLHLRQAIAHARLGAADRAEEHLSTARELVALGIPAHPRYGMSASAENVQIHWVAVPVELTDGTTAVGRAEQIRLPDRTEPHRAGHHWVDVARAWTLHSDRAKALDALNQARRIAPQQTRYHPSVHETVHLLAETDRRATDSLAGFARWAGITL
jgi:transcriptional regulator with XRE-family HTH domain